MTRTLTFAEAQADFPRLVDAACNGDEIRIVGGGRPAVCLKSLTQAEPAASQPDWVLDYDEWRKQVSAIRASRRPWMGPPLSAEEIIEARDEGRR